MSDEFTFITVFFSFFIFSEIFENKSCSFQSYHIGNRMENHKCLITTNISMFAQNTFFLTNSPMDRKELIYCSTQWYLKCLMSWLQMTISGEHSGFGNVRILRPLDPNWIMLKHGFVPILLAHVGAFVFGTTHTVYTKRRKQSRASRGFCWQI